MEGILNAIRQNEFNVLVEILSAKPDIDLNTYFPEEGYWAGCGEYPVKELPLHLAVDKCNLEAVEYLVSHGADINIKDNHGDGILDHLLSSYSNSISNRSQLPIIEFLVRKGADISLDSFRNVLNWYSDTVQIFTQTYHKDVVMDPTCRIKVIEKKNDFEIIEYFIGAPDFFFQEHKYNDVDTVSFLEHTQKMLNKFIEKKSWENALRFILIHPFSNIFNSVGGRLDEKIRILETITENLTDFSFVDHTGTKFVDEIFRKFLTPDLFKRIDDNILKKILEAGADKGITTEVLTSYLRHGNYGEAELDIVKKYVEFGVELNMPLPTKELPIHAACANQTREVIEYLIDHGADINIKDNDNHNALDYLIMSCSVNYNTEHFSLIESFVKRGVDIEESFYYAFQRISKYDRDLIYTETLQSLMRARNKDIALKPLKKSRDITNTVSEPWGVDILYYVRLTFERELDFDILEYLIGAPDLVFQDFGISSNSYEALQYTYKMLNQFMEKKSWGDALRLILVYLYSFDRTINNNYSLGECEDNKTGIIETIMENQIDFSYVDPHGTKFVDAMFEKYLEFELFKQINENVGNKLLEAGADRNAVNESLNKYMQLDEYDIHIVKKFLATGVDLDMSLNHNGAEIPLCDAVYMAGALYGDFDLAEEMIAKGADIGCILLSKEIEKIFKNDSSHDRVQFVLDKLMAGGILNDRSTKMGPRGESFVEFFEYHDCGSVLVKCGLLPKTPRGLTVTHSGVSCCLSWEPAEGTEDFPLTGHLIQSWNGITTVYNRKTNLWDGVWFDVATIDCKETFKFEISGLKTNDTVKFRVFARNYYGFSAPLEDPADYHSVIVLPSPPGQPEHEVMGDDITITWAPPAEGGYRALTKYRVEGGNKGQDWRSLGTIAISHAEEMYWARKMKIFDFKRRNFNQVRIIAVNTDGDSEPSEPSVLIQP